VLVALKEGMFAKAGLPNVKFSLIGTPTNSYPELLANKIQVLDGTATTTIGFNANGAPVNIVAGGEVEDTTAQNEWFKVLALKSSHITSLKQLVGKKVAVGQLNSLGTLDLSGALLKEGLSPTAIHFVALPFPNQLAALKSGEVAAMWQGEPYVTQSLATGTTNVVCGCGYIAQPEVPVGSMTMTTTYEKAHPEVAAAVRKVYPEAVKYIQTHPAEARALAKSSLGVSSYTAAHLQLPTYVTPYPLAAFHGLEKLELKLGYIKKIPPDSSVLALK
jgi:NitT/TauT family transport system substrate-binding protein